MEKTWPLKFLKTLRSRFKFDPDFKTKTQKKPFIIPSRFGFYFGSGLIVLIILAYTYANHLIYLIAFFYSSILFITMHLTNNNIKFVDVVDMHINSFYQDEQGLITLTLRNNHSKYSARNINIAIEHSDAYTRLPDIEPNQYATINIPLSPFHRGKHRYPKLTLSTRFPFNLFYSWKKLSWPEHYFNYPTRSGSLELPNFSHEGLSNELGLPQLALESQTDNFLGHKEFNNYENFKRIDWKVFARKNKLYVKVFEKENPKIAFLDLIHFFTSYDDLEKCLSQLSLWSHQIEKHNGILFIKDTDLKITAIQDPKGYKKWNEALSLTIKKEIVL